MPHSRTLSRRAALAAALLALAGAIASPPRALADPGLTPRERSLLAAVNTVRAQHSLPAVALDARLVRAARSHSAEMLGSGVFRHGPFVRRLVRFGVRGPIVGEDLGWTVEDARATSRIVTWWLQSPRHRAVLLRPGFRRVGIGVARGPFLGHPRCIVVTADFQGR